MAIENEKNIFRIMDKKIVEKCEEDKKKESI